MNQTMVDSDKTGKESLDGIDDVQAVGISLLLTMRAEASYVFRSAVQADLFGGGLHLHRFHVVAFTLRLLESGEKFLYHSSFLQIICNSLRLFLFYSIIIPSLFLASCQSIGTKVFIVEEDVPMVQTVLAEVHG